MVSTDAKASVTGSAVFVAPDLGLCTTLFVGVGNTSIDVRRSEADSLLARANAFCGVAFVREVLSFTAA